MMFTKVLAKSCVVAYAIAGLVAVCGGADSTTWNGGDGNWDDSTKWSNGAPSRETPGEVRFKTTGQPYTVTLNHDVTNTHFIVLSPASGVAMAPVTLTGSGSVTNTGASGINYAFETQENTSFILDVPAFRTHGATNIRGGLEIKSGTYTQDAVLYTTRSNSFVRVSGGSFYVPRLKLSETNDASYVQTGGYAYIPTIERTSANPFSIKGGSFRRSSLTIPIGVTDWRNVTNVVYDITFNGGTTIADTAYYCSPGLVIGSKFKVGTGHSYAGFPIGITFGAYGNWELVSATRLYIRERFHVNTADFYNPTVPRSINMLGSKELDNAPFDLAVYGGGSFNFALNDNYILFNKIDGFTLGEGTTMTMVRSQNNYRRKNNILAQKMKLGAGSDFSLMMRYTFLESTDTAEIEEGATINAYIYTKTTDPDFNYSENRYPILTAGPTGSVENLTVNLTGDGTEGWTVHKLLNSAWVDNGKIDMTPDPSRAWEWCGGADGNLSTPANWSCGAASNVINTGKAVVFRTMQGMITNDLDNVNVARLTATNSCGPVRMRGKPVTVSNSYRVSSYSPIGNFSMFPFVFENDITATGSTYFGVTSGNSRFNSATYIAFLGKLTVNSPVFSVSGHVVIGGEATANSILMDTRFSSSTGGRRASMLEILSGGSMTVSMQTNTFSNASDTSLRVNEGGILSFTGGKFDNRTPSTHRVHGLMDIDVPLSSTTNLSFFGTGRVNVASTKSSTKAAKVRIGDGLRLYPKTWNTLTTDGVGPIKLYVLTRATIGAKADWTYGPAAGVTTTTTPGERALVTEAIYSPLTIDTTDPDTGAGHKITFADPILAAGDVAVKGVGAVSFASGEDSFGGILSFDGDVALVLSAAQRQAALGNWAAILTATKIEGVPRTADGVRLRVADNGDGTQSLMCRVVCGTMFTVR